MARKRTNARKDYAPTIDAELDLHGCFAREAVSMLHTFLRVAREKGYGRVRVIVGKGTHSPNGPVLPDVVKAQLNKEGYGYTYAKVHEGGEGALVVLLRD